MSAMVAASLAFTLARSRAGIAIAAMIPMMATTIRSSINENPRIGRMLIPPLAAGGIFIARDQTATFPNGDASEVEKGGPKPPLFVNDYFRAGQLATFSTAGGPGVQQLTDTVIVSPSRP